MDTYHRRIYSMIGVIFFLISLGTVFYHNMEGWSIVDSLYFTAATLTTVGYGDFTPKSDISKLFTVGFILSGVGVIFASLTFIGSHYIEEHHPKVEKAIMKRLNRNTLNKFTSKGIVEGSEESTNSKKK